jgi:hypothetical protein
MRVKLWLARVNEPLSDGDLHRLRVRPVNRIFQANKGRGKMSGAPS